MTVPAQTPINRHLGNGVSTVFPYTFKVLSADDLQVTIDGVTQAGGFTVSGVRSNSGDVTFTTAPAQGALVVLRRAMSVQRTTDYQDQGAMPAATVDDDHDGAVMLIQQLAANQESMLQFPATEGASGVLPAAAERAGKLAGFTSNGDAMTAYDLTLADDPLQHAEQLRGDLIANTGADRIGAGSGRSVRQRLDSIPAEVSATVTAEANRAAAARDAALIQAGVYATESAGRAAVGDGQAFKVQGSGDVAAYEYRRVNSTTSTLIATYPAAAAVTAISEQIGDGFDMVGRVSPLAQHVTDSTDKVIGGIGLDARVYQGTPRGLFPLPDAHMLNPLGADGWPDDAALEQAYVGAVPTAYRWRVAADADGVLYIIVVIGQSLAGAANDNVSDTIFNPTPTYPAQVFMPGVGHKPDGMDFDWLTPAYEYAGTGYDSNFESPLTTMMNSLRDEVLATTGKSPKFCSFMASRGSRTWEQIGPGNEAWYAFTKGLAGCVKAAASMGLRPVVPAVFYVQGEQDRVVGLSRTASARHRLNMAREVRRVVRQLTHQPEETVVFVSQPNNAVAGNGLIPGHMLAPLDVDGIDGIRVMPPNYPYTVPSNVHPDSASYVTMGQHMARMVMDECFGAGYYPLKIAEARWYNDHQIDLVYSLRNGPLVIDTSGSVVTPPTWTGSLYGFQVFDETTTYTINSASVVTDTTIEATLGANARIIRLVLDTAPSGRSVRVHYATRNDGTGSNAGRATGARGCVRDSSTLPVWANSQVVEL